MAVAESTVLRAAPKKVAATRPNIVVIFADDHAENAVGVCGSRMNKTPNIDRLAAEGMRFTQSFVANSICGPSRATLLTGLHSHANGQTGNGRGFRNNLPTFAKILQTNGYDTAVVGKWHVSAKPTGFTYWALKRGNYYNSPFETPTGREKSEGHVTDTITDRSLKWIGRRTNQKKPFMVWISHATTHRTWIPAIRHLTKYDDRKIAEPTNLFDDYKGRAAGAKQAQMRISKDLFPSYDLKLPITGKGTLDRGAVRHRKMMTQAQLTAWDAAYGPKNAAYAKLNLQGNAKTSWNYQRYIKNYLRCVDGLDESVAKVRQYLKDHGLDKNTIVIYTSDQGFFLGEHGWYDKRWMYEESLRTPLIVHWPGVVAAGKTCDAMVQNIDLAPTFIDMAQLKAPKTMHGESLVPFLKNQPAKNQPGKNQKAKKWRDAIYYHYQMNDGKGRTSHIVAKHYGIRTTRYKLIYFYELKQWELYDLKTDPREMTNLSASKKHATIQTDLKKRLRALRKQFDDKTGVDFPEKVLNDKT